jgi:hypothetical protein
MGGPSQSAENQNVANQNTLAQQELNQVAIPQEQMAQSLFNMTSPGLQTAENFYSQLASGDPSAIFKQIAPAVEQITAQTQGAKQQIMANTPRGGVQQLALDQAGISQAGQVGQLATQAYTSSFPALAQLAGEGIGLSNNQISNVVSAYGGASSAYRGAGAEAGEIAQQGAEGKATTMGFVGSLVGSGVEAGGEAAEACYIAAKVFGEDFFTGRKTALVRAWLWNRWAFAHWYAPYVLWLYAKIGERASSSRIAVGLLRPLFKKALQKAEESS